MLKAEVEMSLSLTRMYVNQKYVLLLEIDRYGSNMKALSIT